MSKKNEGLKKHTTNINEVARERLGITRDDYALCQYVQYRLADTRGKKSGWCSDKKEELAKFIGITRPGVYKMLERMERVGLLEIDPPTGFCRVTPKWIDTEQNRKQSLQDDVNKVYKECKQSLHGGVNKVTRNIEEKDIEKEEQEQEREIADAAGAELIIKSTTEIEGVTLVEKMNVEAEKEKENEVPPPVRPTPGESAPRRWDVFDIDKAAAELKENVFSAENFARITGTPKAQMLDRFTEEVDVFVLEQKGKKSIYNRFDEFSSHFFNYERAKVRAARNYSGPAQQRQNFAQPDQPSPKSYMPTFS